MRFVQRKYARVELELASIEAMLSNLLQKLGLNNSWLPFVLNWEKLTYRMYL